MYHLKSSPTEIPKTNQTNVRTYGRAMFVFVYELYIQKVIVSNWNNIKPNMAFHLLNKHVKLCLK